MGYRVTAPLVQAKKADGSYVHVYDGGSLPEDIDDTQLEQLLQTEMVEKDDGASDKPKASAGVAAWREYAVAQGVASEDEAAGMSKDDLRALFDDE